MGAQGDVGDGGCRVSEILGVSERQFQRYRRRYEEEGLGGLVDRRLDKASVRRVPVDQVMWMLSEYCTRHRDWNVKSATHFVPVTTTTDGDQKRSPHRRGAGAEFERSRCAPHSAAASASRSRCHSRREE
jgi:hypothetical protein